MTNVLGLDHVSILVKDAERSAQFYRTLLGLEILPRPDLGFPGYWLDLGAEQSLHIMQLDNPNAGTVRPEHGGRDYHFALRVVSIESFKARLENEGIAYTQSRSGRKALFVKDPDENAFELFEFHS
ncbi:MAG: VOC family protein [Thiomicrorhabdus chilensis]|uniref:VOC family protein n=1 Tax=Thiomicrorhabdus chilensis TaxID=63656 RepID=UPI00299EAE1D|nr:VOC family protein [Thiomicrorhabdus chilensis]MDX1348260.1 VOC family protein [Thiomicrorhabdus chilensis]